MSDDMPREWRVGWSMLEDIEAEAKQLQERRSACRSTDDCNSIARPVWVRARELLREWNAAVCTLRESGISEDNPGMRAALAWAYHVRGVIWASLRPLFGTAME